MALMNYREANQVLWRGVRPAHNGTQIVKYIFACNNVTIIHTVSAGTTFHLCSFGLGVHTVAAGTINVAVRNAADVFQYYLAMAEIVAGVTTMPFQGTFWPPLEIPAGYDLVVQSNAVVLTVMGMCFGWEE